MHGWGAALLRDACGILPEADASRLIPHWTPLALEPCLRTPARVHALRNDEIRPPHGSGLTLGRGRPKLLAQNCLPLGDMGITERHDVAPSRTPITKEDDEPIVESGLRVGCGDAARENTSPCRLMVRANVQPRREGRDARASIVGQGTPGFSGVDLANLVNEAGILAVCAGPRRSPPSTSLTLAAGSLLG
jgi:hypothetical protein